MSPDDGEPLEARDEISAEGAAGSAAPPETTTAGFVDLPRGEALQPVEARVVMGTAPTRLVMIGGPFNSGKTTLVASIYERFRRGPFAGFEFAGSHTLVGFERICHLGREVSGLPEADTEHTSKQLGKQLYHLRLRDTSRSALQDMLLTDVSGELFDSLRDHSDESRDIGIIKRADHFVLMADGRKLSDLGLRDQANDDSCTVLRRLVETGLLSASSRVDVFFSKYDLVETAAPANKTEKFVERVEKNIRERFEGSLGQLRFGRIKARSMEGTSSLPASGVEGFLPSWCRDTQFPQKLSRFAIGDWSQYREFDRFLATMGRKGRTQP